MSGPRLIDLQTDLKSLRYGSDKPYITKDINNPPSSNQTGMQITKRVDDLSRIAQMLVDRPGLTFIGNQALLQQADVQGKLQKARDKKTTLGGKVFEQVKNTVLNTAKILGSTIAQVPVNGTGTHFVYAFRTDTYLQPSGGNTRSAFAQFFGAGGVEGAPFALKGQEVPGVVKSSLITSNHSLGKVTNPETGKGSKYQYDAPINESRQNGIDTFWNEIPNKKIEDSIPVLQNSYKAKQGQVVSTTSKEKASSLSTADTVDVRDADIIEADVTPTPPTDLVSTRETTVASGSFGISNRGVVVDVVGNDVTIAPFKEDESTRKSKSDTVSNIRNAQTGSAVPLKDSSRETTTVITGSVSHQGVAFDVPETSTDNVGKTYTSENTYTGKSTANNITTVTAPATGAGSGTFNKIVLDGSGMQDSIEQTIGTYLRNKYALAPGLFADPPADIVQFPKRLDDLENETIANRFKPPGNVQDFRSGLPYSFDYNSSTINRETRVNLGNQGKVSFDRSTYGNSSDKDTHDTLNSLDIQNNDRAAGNSEGRDFAKFYFEIITPEGSKFLHFRAFIDSIDDSYNADWQGFNYVGRGEKFYTYGGFERDINISFKIAAATRAEMKPLYRKMVYLASSTAPTYGGEGFMRGTLAKLTIGSYFSQLPGVITSVKYSLIQDMPWELSMQSPEQGGDSDVQELPMGLQCTISYKVIHNFAPQTGLQHYFTNPNPVNAQDFLK